MRHQRQQRIEIVKFDQVGFAYEGGKKIFHNLSYSLFAGGFYFLTGTSGVGKTTLMRLIYRDVSPTAGSIHVFGKDLATLKPDFMPNFRQRMGLVFQDCRLINHLSVLDNVALPMRIAGSDSRHAFDCAKELLHWVNLGDHFNDTPQTLSDGQKQRVAIARAVIAKPLLLLADEPTGNLDSKSANRLMALFEELNKMGTTIVLATHNKELVKSFPYTELRIKHGRLIADPSEDDPEEDGGYENSPPNNNHNYNY